MNNSSLKKRLLSVAMAAVMAKSDMAPEIRLLTLVSMAQSSLSLMMRWLTPNMITMA